MDLFEAVTKRDNAALAEALGKDPKAAAARNADGASLLAFAAYNGNKDAIALIRKALPQLDPYEAIIIGETESVRAAIAGGWDPNPLSPDGFTPLALAAFFSHGEILDLLLPLIRDVNGRATNVQQVAALHAATAVRDLTAVGKLLRAGADPDLPQQAGYLPIHVAAQHGDAAIVGLLLLFGATPNLANASGKTAADHAIAGGHDWLAELLRAAG